MGLASLPHEPAAAAASPPADASSAVTPPVAGPSGAIGAPTLRALGPAPRGAAATHEGQIAATGPDAIAPRRRRAATPTTARAVRHHTSPSTPAAAGAGHGAQTTGLGHRAKQARGDGPTAGPRVAASTPTSALEALVDGRAETGATPMPPEPRGGRPFGAPLHCVGIALPRPCRAQGATALASATALAPEKGMATATAGAPMPRARAVQAPATGHHLTARAAKGAAARDHSAPGGLLTRVGRALTRPRGLAKKVRALAVPTPVRLRVAVLRPLVPPRRDRVLPVAVGLLPLVRPLLLV